MGKVVQAVAGAAMVVAGAITGNVSLIITGVSTFGSAVLSPKAKQQARQASVTSLSIGEVSREAILGEALTGGSLVDAFNFGGKYGTDWEVRVVALADHECAALVGFYVNDQYVAFGGDGNVAGFNNQLQVYWRPGTLNQAVPQVLLTNQPGCTANDNGAGVAYVVVAYKADAQDAKNPVWPGGRPTFAWRVRGAKCYIPRKDSTVPGGLGAHRYADPSTWEWTDNLIDCRYAWVRGFYACNRMDQPDMLLVGRGLPASAAPPENTFAPANVCDELVEGERRYRIGGVISADQSYIEVEETFALSCAGVIVQPGGAVEIEPGQAKAPVAFITDDDLLVGSKVEYRRYRSKADASWVNTVIPRYVEPTLKWADHAAPVRRDIDDIMADGGPREETVSLSLVTFAKQAGRVGEVYRRLGRLVKHVPSITLGPRFAEIEEGDWIVWTSQRHFGGASLIFRVESYGLDAKWHNTLSLREIGPSVYTEGPFIADQASNGQQFAPALAQQPGAAAWAAAAEQLSATGGRIPAIVITGAIDDPYAQQVRFEYWRSPEGAPPPADTQWTSAGIFGPATQRREISSVAGGATYYAAVSYLVGGVPSDRRVLGPITTGVIQVVVGEGPGDRGNIIGVGDAPIYADDIITDRGTSKDTNAVGSRPSAELLAQIDQAREDLAAVPGTVDQINATIETLATNVNGRVDQVDGRVDLTVQRQSAAERASRQLDRQLADIGKSLLRVAVEADRTRATFRDAGIHVDAEKGEVRFEAIEQTREQLAQTQFRMTAAEAAIQLRVTAAYVNQKIVEAVLDPSQVAELEEVYFRIVTAEQLLSALQASIVTKADAQTLTNLGLVVTDVANTIDALNGLIQSKAETSTVDALGTRVGAVETTLDSLGDVVGVSTEIRQVRYAVGLTGKALLEAIVAGDELKRGQVQSQASIQSQLTTTINDKVGAEAASRQALAVEVGEARADMVDERAVRAAADRAEAAARVALGLQFGQANADVLDQIEVLVQADSAQVERANQIAAAVGQQASDITEIRELDIDRDRSIAGITTAVRQSRAIGSDTAHSLLSTIVAADEAKRQSLVASSNLFSQVTSEITAQGEVKTQELRRLEAMLTSVDSALKAAVTSLNQAIVNGDGAQASALQSVAAALEAVRGDLNAAVTRLDQANVTQDTAMSESLFLVNAAIATLDGNIDAAVTRLDQANVDQDSAAAQSLAGVNASIESLSGTVNGEITRLDQVSANVDGKASVQSVTDLSLRVGEAEGGITNLSSVTSDIDGRLKAIHGVLLDVNGRVSGTISENDGVQSSFEILSDVFRISATGTGDRTEYIDGIWRVYAGGGATLKAYGSPFGSNGQFVSWFGPQVPLDQCTEANAISYEKADGSTYFGGSLSLGTLRTAFTNPSLGASVTAPGDPFGSNGKTIVVTASWSYQYVNSANYNSTTEGLAEFDAAAAFYGATDEGGGLYRGTYSDSAPATTLALERSVSGGDFAGAAAQSSTARTATFQGQRPVIGDAAGWSSVQTIAGLSFTFVDPQLSTAVRNYRVILARGFNAPSNAQQLSQAVTFTAVEQPNV